MYCASGTHGGPAMPSPAVRGRQISSALRNPLPNGSGEPGLGAPADKRRNADQQAASSRLVGGLVEAIAGPRLSSSAKSTNGTRTSTPCAMLDQSVSRSS